MSAFNLGDAVWVKGGGCIACCFVTGYGCGLNCEKLHPEEDGHYIRPPAPPADKTTERPAAPSPDIYYPMTNGELMDAISRLGNLPASSGFCSGSVEKEIEYQIKFLLKVQRKRALIMEERRDGGK